MMHPSLLSFAVWAQYFVTFGASLPGCIRTLATRGAAHLPLVWRCKDLFQRQIRSGFDMEILQWGEIAQNIGVSFQGPIILSRVKILSTHMKSSTSVFRLVVINDFHMCSWYHPSFSSPRSQWVGDLHCCWGSLKERQVSQLKMGFAGVKWSRFGCFPLVPSPKSWLPPEKGLCPCVPIPYGEKMWNLIHVWFLMVESDATTGVKRPSDRRRCEGKRHAWHERIHPWKVRADVGFWMLSTKLNWICLISNIIILAPIQKKQPKKISPRGGSQTSKAGETNYPLPYAT